MSKKDKNDLLVVFAIGKYTVLVESVGLYLGVDFVSLALQLSLTD